MNLVSSKLLRSSKPVVNRSLETMHAYSCQLYLDSFKVSYRGFVYFLWYTHSTQISSLRYQSTGKTVPVKKTLTISLRVASKNGRQQPFNTYLKLMAQSGEELDEFQISINNLTSQFRELELPMDRGLCMVKIRRKGMNITEDQETNFRGMLYRSKHVKNHDMSVISGSVGECESLQEELNRTKKELEDELYLNNKLKNDRDVLMATKQELEIQIESIMVQATREIKMLSEHYDNKISIREHSYEEEIQNLVNMFNSDNAFSKKVLDSLMRQKIKAEDELKSATEKMKAGEQQLSKREEKTSCLEKELATHIERIRILQLTATQHETLSIQRVQKIKGLQEELKVYGLRIEDMTKELLTLKQKNQQMEVDHKNKDIQLQSLADALTTSSDKQQSTMRQNQLLRKQTEMLQQQRRKTNEQMEALKAKLQECQYQMEFNESVMGQLKMQQQQKEEQLYQQLENLEKIYDKKMEDLLNHSQIEKDKLLTTSQAKQKQKQDLFSKIKGLQSNVGESQLKINELMAEIDKKVNEVEQNKRIVAQKLDIIVQLESQIKEMGQQLQLKQEQHNLKKQGGNKGMFEDFRKQIQILKREKEELREEVKKLIVSGDKMKASNGRLKSSKDNQKQQQDEVIEKGLTEQEIHGLIQAKDNQLEGLKKKIGELEKIYFMMQVKIDKILQLYPDVDIEKVNVEIPIMQLCDSEIDQQKILHKQSNSDQPNLETFTPQPYESANKKKLARLRTIDAKFYEPRSEQRLPQLQDMARNQSGKISPIKVEVARGNGGNREQNILKDNASQRSGQSWVRVSHTKRIKDLEKQNLSHSQRIQDLQKQIDEFNSRIGRMAELQKQNAKLLKKQSIHKEQIKQYQQLITMLKGEVGQLNQSQAYIHPPQPQQTSPQQKTSPQQQQPKTLQSPQEALDLTPSFLPSQQNYIPQAEPNSPHPLPRQPTPPSPKSQPREADKFVTVLPSEQYDRRDPQLSGKSALEPSVVIQKVERHQRVNRQQLAPYSPYPDERMQLQSIMKTSMMQSAQIETKKAKINALQDDIKQAIVSKKQKQGKLARLQIFCKELQEKQKELQKYIETLTQANRHLQKELAEMDQNYSRERQNGQQTRLSLKQLNIHYEQSQIQLKKLKNQNQTLEDKIQKLAGLQMSNRQLARQIEDMGKKSLQMIRNVNHLKLQKDSTDEEIRLVKKRQSDQVRIATEWEEKAASLERLMEEMKRKESKLKREIEDSQEETRRIKLQAKKIEDELQALSTSQIGWQVQRRKYLDQISSLQDHQSRKEYQLTKLSKEVQRWKIKAEQKDDYRLGRKNEFRQQIERLQNELIRKEKKVFQQVEQNKLLRGRLQVLQRQNKRMMQQKNQSYSQKLRYYVDQMSSIKKLLNEYQNQNSRLKVESNQLYEQLQMTRTSYDKLQMRYDENIGREEDILNDLQLYIDEGNSFKDRLSQAHRNISQLEGAFSNVRRQADEQKNLNKKMNEKLQGSQRTLENALMQNREFKIRISEYETNSQINGKIGQKYRLLQRKGVELQEECKRLKAENQHLSLTFIFKRQDLENAVNQVRNQQRRLKEEQLHRMQQDCNKTVFTKTQRLEQELLDLYNQNNKLRSDLQASLQDSGRQKGRIVELQLLCQKTNVLQSQNQLNRIALDQLRDELRRKTDRIGKNEVMLEGLESENGLKERQLEGLRKAMGELQGRIEKLNGDLRARRAAQKQLQQALIRSSDKKGQQKSQLEIVYRQRQMTLISQNESKLSSLEAELKKMREKQARAIDQNTNKMRTLEQKMDEMQEAMREKEKAIEGHYEGEIHELEHSLIKLSEELKGKHGLIDELNEAIIVLEGDNVDLSKQMQDINYNNLQDRELLQNQLNKLRSKMKETENAYATNLKTLEQELTKVNHSKNSNNNSNSRLRGADQQERANRRVEDKLKGKDKKIDELKETIYTLQDTILRLRKKESHLQSTLVEIDKMRLMLSQLQGDKQKIKNQWGSEQATLMEEIRALKKEILRLRESEEKGRLIAEEKALESDSMSSQLKTIKELYQELQRELQRRKHALSLQLQEESSFQYQARLQQSKIIELEERVLGYIKTVKDYELSFKKKEVEGRRSQQILQQLKKSEVQLKEEIVHLNQEVASLKQSLNDCSTSCESAKSELKYSKTEVLRLRKVQEDLKLANNQKEQLSLELKRTHQDMTKRYRNAEQQARKYSALSQQSRNSLGFCLQQLLQRYSILAEEKDLETNELIQEIEELKFLNERKFMDYDEIKRNNFELQLKVEEYQSLSDQLDTLRKICDKLQDEKKNAIFREEVLRMQVENLGVSCPQETKSRIDAILATPIVPSFANFSFY